MPRIAAAAGVVALIVFSIGFNMARYPSVWDMVGADSHLPQPSPSSQSLAFRETAGDPQPEAVVKPTISWQATPVALPADEDNSSDTASRVSEEPPAVVDDQVNPQELWETVRDGSAPAPVASVGDDSDVRLPQEVKPSSKYASSAEQHGPLAQSISIRPLVPLVRAEPRRDPAVRSAFNPDVRRLPPVDQVGPVIADRSLAGSPEGPIPFYPSTGIE